MKIFLPILSIALLASCLRAQVPSNNSNQISLGIAETSTTLATVGFQAATADTVDVQNNGFPPQPDPSRSPEAYRSWMRAVEAAKVQIQPQLAVDSRAHGLIQSPASAPLQSALDGNTAEASLNWSGYVISSPANAQGAPVIIQQVSSEFVIPTATQIAQQCDGGWDYSSSWIGLDGSTTADVLQAGTEADAYCAIDPNIGSSSVSTLYSTWFEWFPQTAVRITNLPVAAGNDIYVSVWSTSPTQGNVFIVNLNSGQFAQIGLVAPAGVTLMGTSAEWVIERPTVGGAFANLANFTSQYFANTYALTNSGREIGPRNNAAIPVVMLDGTSMNPIATPELMGSHGILIEGQPQNQTLVQSNTSTGITNSLIDWYPDWIF